MKKRNEATDLMPFDYLGDNHAITAYGDVVFGCELEMIESFTMADSNESELDAASSEVNVFYHDYKTALSKLEEGTIIQKIVKVYSLPHKRNDSGGSKTRRWNEDMFIKRDVMFEKTYLLILMPFRQYKKGGKLGGIFSRVERFKGVEYIEEFISKYESFQTSLETVCQNIRQLNSNEIVDLYVDCWNLGEGNELLQPLEVVDSGLVVGNKNVAVLTSSKLPGSFDGFTKMNRSLTETNKLNKKSKNNLTNYRSDVLLPTSYLFPLGIGLPIDHLLIETIKIEFSDEVDTRLSKESSSLNFLIGLRFQDAINKKNDINEIKLQKSEFNFKYASWGCTLILKHTDKSELANMVNLVTDKASKELGMVLAVHNSKAFKSFYAALPGCARINENLRLTFLEVCSYMTHIESFKRANSSGIVLVDLFGRPFVFDFWDEFNKYVEARNGVIYAPTGQGKSFLVNHLLDQSFWGGDFIFLIDVGGSYKRITALNNGTYIDSKNLENLRFNPFLDCYNKGGIYYPELDERGNKDSMYVDFIATLIVSCYDPTGELNSRGALDVLKRSVNQYFAKVNKESISVGFDSYYEFLKLNFFEENKEYSTHLNFNEFLLVMEKYKSNGAYGFLLNSDTTFDLTNRWITFDLVGVADKKELQGPTLLIVMNLFEKMKNIHYGNRVRMFIEEAVDFLQGGVFSDYIGGLYRKIRKYGGQVFIVTQSIEFLDKLDPLVSASIQTNSEIKIILNHAKVSFLYPRLIKDLSLSRSEAELIKNQTTLEDSKYRIGFMKFGSMKGFLFRHEVSPETFAMYQTNASEIKKIDDLIERTGNVVSAVETYIEDNNKDSVTHEVESEQEDN